MQKSVIAIIVFCSTSLSATEKSDVIQWQTEQKKAVNMILERKKENKKILNFSMQWQEEKKKTADSISIWQEKQKTVHDPLNTDPFKQSCSAYMTGKTMFFETERCLRRIARLKEY